MPSSCCPSKLDKSRRMLLTKKGMGLLEEANQPRVFQLGMNIKVFAEDHKRGFYFHIFGQIFWVLVKKIEQQMPVLNFIKSEYSKHIWRGADGIR